MKLSCMVWYCIYCGVDGWGSGSCRGNQLGPGEAMMDMEVTKNGNGDAAIE